jgi:hypothetical protein
MPTGPRSPEATDHRVTVLGRLSPAATAPSSAAGGAETRERGEGPRTFVRGESEDGFALTWP